MAIFQINKNPSRRDLLIFSAILPVFFALVGAFRWHAGSIEVAKLLWSVGMAVSALALFVPTARRRIYVGWMYATFPIAWTVSHIILGAMYFLVATPVALLLRLFGRDPMQRKFDKAAQSYWVLRQPNQDSARYFRQF
jgi:hypothetical protein